MPYMAAGNRLEKLVTDAGFTPAEIAKVTKKAPTTVGAWFREKNKLSRANESHVEWVKAVLAFIRAEDQEDAVWMGGWGKGGSADTPGRHKNGKTVASVLLDLLEQNNIPDSERTKARRALEVVLGLN